MIWGARLAQRNLLPSGLARAAAGSARSAEIFSAMSPCELKSAPPKNESSDPLGDENGGLAGEPLGKHDAEVLLALPTSQENFGIVFAEMLACQTPVLVTEGVDICQELLGSGGALLIRRDPGDIAEKISALCGGPRRRPAPRAKPDGNGSSPTSPPKSSRETMARGVSRDRSDKTVGPPPPGHSPLRSSRATRLSTVAVKAACIASRVCPRARPHALGLPAHMARKLSIESGTAVTKPSTSPGASTAPAASSSASVKAISASAARHRCSAVLLPVFHRASRARSDPPCPGLA